MAKKEKIKKEDVLKDPNKASVEKSEEVNASSPGTETEGKKVEETPVVEETPQVLTKKKVGKSPYDGT